MLSSAYVLSMCYMSCVEERGWSHLENDFRFEVECQRKYGRPKRTWKK